MKKIVWNGFYIVSSIFLFVAVFQDRWLHAIVGTLCLILIAIDQMHKTLKEILAHKIKEKT